jgi:hypothetical protein
MFEKNGKDNEDAAVSTTQTNQEPSEQAFLRIPEFPTRLPLYS